MQEKNKNTKKVRFSCQDTMRFKNCKLLVLYEDVFQGCFLARNRK